ncbi:MAG: Tn3 family transposase, partial [Candidatus Acidiferrales bacterium]
VQFGSTPAGQPVIDALNYLFKVEEQGRSKAGDAPMQLVTRGWRQYVLNEGGFDRKAYVFCCLDRARSTLRRRDIFVSPSIRYTDARLGLLSESAWSKARPTIARSLGHSLSATETLSKLAHQLDATYKRGENDSCKNLTLYQPS